MFCRRGDDAKAVSIEFIHNIVDGKSQSDFDKLFEKAKDKDELS